MAGFSKDLEKIFELTADDKIELGQELKKEIKENLHIGNSSFGIEYDLYGEGHENLTFVHKYLQSLRELYNFETSITEMRINTIELQSDLLEAVDKEKSSEKDYEKLKWKSKRLMAEHNIKKNLFAIEDKLRQKDIHKKVYSENAPLVKKHFKSRDEAERYMWEMTYHYRALKDGPKARLDNCPVVPEVKARLGAKYGRKDSALPLMFEQNIVPKLKQERKSVE